MLLKIAYEEKVGSIENDTLARNLYDLRCDNKSGASAEEIWIRKDVGESPAGVPEGRQGEDEAEGGIFEMIVSNSMRPFGVSQAVYRAFVAESCRDSSCISWVIKLCRNFSAPEPSTRMKATCWSRDVMQLLCNEYLSFRGGGIDENCFFTRWKIATLGRSKCAKYVEGSQRRARICGLYAISNDDEGDAYIGLPLPSQNAGMNREGRRRNIPRKITFSFFFFL